MSNCAPIGVFDSGFGGLTAVRELRRILPGENIVYFGDNARIPYGDKSAETIIKYACQDAAFLLSLGVKAILVACGTVSSVAIDVLKEKISVPVVGVIEPAAKRALALSKKGMIGVLGTKATVKSGSYERFIRTLDGKVSTVGVACPLLVPLVENGYVSENNQITRLAVREYIEPIEKSGCDCIILGCTHYPLLERVFKAEWAEGELINTGREAAVALSDILKASDALSPDGSRGGLKLYSSDSAENFIDAAAMYLGEAIKDFERVDILSYGL
ncbi:MAG: glutamate racemase [Ruminococcaceae bacterium]|nr:glutamate racemase [Oscillospiraceae bacterium]